MSLHIRTVVLLIETETREDEVLRPHLVGALRAYAEALESGEHGRRASDDFVTGNSTVRCVHGSDLTA